MKLLKIYIDPILIKGDLDDMETLRSDVYDEILSMIESGTLEFHPDEEESEDCED